MLPTSATSRTERSAGIPEPLRDGHHDPGVRLVGDQDVDVRGRVLRLLEEFAARAGHLGDGTLEDLAALRHPDRVIACIDRLVCRRCARPACGHLEDRRRGAVGTENRPLDPGPVRCLHDHGAGSVAEQDRRRPVGEVQDPAEDLGPHQQDRVGHPRLDERRGAGQPVAEAGARRVHVEGGSPDAELLLRPDGGRGEGGVAGDARDDDQVELVRRDRGSVHRGSRRLHHEIRRVDVLVREVAGLDAGPLPDPLVVGVDLVLEPRVGNESGRERGPDAA